MFGPCSTCGGPMTTEWSEADHPVWCDRCEEPFPTPEATGHAACGFAMWAGMELERRACWDRIDALNAENAVLLENCHRLARRVDLHYRKCGCEGQCARCQDDAAALSAYEALP